MDTTFDGAAFCTLGGLGCGMGSVAILTLGAGVRSTLDVAKGFGAPFGVALKMSANGYVEFSSAVQRSCCETGRQ